jgi:hypothetical protein
MATKVTKHDLVRKHLLKKKSITSWDAITLYKATRLSAIIFTLRKSGWNISTKPIQMEEGSYAKYLLISSPVKVG